MKCVTLTTDFGTRDWFVGTMKGVLAGIAPESTVVDLTHEIAPGDVAGGAFSLMASYAYFPKGTIHVAVVDPGVGGARTPLAVKTSKYTFLGPDNGLVSFALRHEKMLEARILKNEAYFLKPVSRTFHGRDIFSPVAAHLARGAAFASVGPRVEQVVKLPWPEPTTAGMEIQGEVVYLDRFGNGLTNIPNASLPPGSGRVVCRIRTNKVWIVPCGSHYQAVPEAAPVVVPGSSGFLEIAVNGGSAELGMRLKRGTRAVVRVR